MKLTKEMIECFKTRLQKPGVCADCPKSETVARREEDNHCLISVKCGVWLDDQGKVEGE